MSPVHISQRIKIRLKELHLRQKDLINRMGVSKGTVSQWVSGGTSPDGQNLLALAKTLETTPEWILTGKETNAESQATTIPTNIVHQAVRIVRHSEILSGRSLSPPDFADRVVDVSFRIENNLGLGDLLSRSDPDKMMMKQAALNAQRILDKVLARPNLNLSEDEKYKLYSDILDDAYQATLLEQELDEGNYLRKA